MFHAKKYEVQSGDTLTSIAKKFGLPSWRIIYDAPANAQWRILRGSPDKIWVGDVISIPPHPVRVLEHRLQTLIRLRRESEGMYNELLNSVNNDYQKVNRVASAVDITATITQLGLGYAKMVQKGVKTMSMTGKELAKAQQQLAISAVTRGPKFAAKQTVKRSSILDITGEEALYEAIPKIIVKSWFDMTTPSYWAQRITGVNIEQVHQETIRGILNNRQRAFAHLDRKIEETRKAILMAR